MDAAAFLHHLVNLTDNRHQIVHIERIPHQGAIFGNLDNPNSTVSRLAQSRRAFRLLEEAGTHPKVIYLHEG